MDIKIFTDMANHHINLWKLPEQGWSWEFNNRKRALGLCDYRKRKLFFSTEFITINAPSILLDTILHEIAHALVGPRFGHGYVWKNKAREVGARPVACKHNANSPEGKYKASCACGNVAQWHRKPKYDVYRCAKCRNRMYVVENNNVSSQARLISSILDDL